MVDEKDELMVDLKAVCLVLPMADVRDAQMVVELVDVMVG